MNSKYFRVWSQNHYDSFSQLESEYIIVLEPKPAYAYLYSAPFNEERTNKLLETLPSTTEKELEKLGHRGNIVLSFHVISAISLLNIDSVCSVCMQSFLAILAEEESASVMVSPAFFSGELGVTQLNRPWQCGHLFCRRELRIFSTKLSETD